VREQRRGVPGRRARHRPHPSAGRPPRGACPGEESSGCTTAADLRQQTLSATAGFGFLVHRCREMSASPRSPCSSCTYEHSHPHGRRHLPGRHRVPGSPHAGGLCDGSPRLGTEVTGFRGPAAVATPSPAA
jgi:hypothetical protein